MRPQIALATLSVVALSACASPREPDLRLPDAYETASSPRVSAPPGAIELDRWWTAFGDPELTALVDQAMARNPDVRTAIARLDEVKGQRSSAILQYLPQGDLNASGRKTETDLIGGTAANIPGFSTSGTSKQYSANFNVSWEIDPYGRAIFATKAANAEVDRARFAYELARSSIAAQTADAYFQARGLAVQLADAQETVRIRKELYGVASKRGERGLAATSEADRVAGDVATAEAQVTLLDAQLQVQKRAILVLAGRVYEPTANVSTPPEVGQAPPVPATLPSELLERRPDVRQAQAALRSAANQQTLAQLAFFPTFYLTPGLGWSKIIQPAFSSETQNWSIGGSVMQPVLSIPRLLADLRSQGARTEQVVTAYEKTVQTAFQESEDALVSLDADRRRVALFTEGEARARRAYNAAREGYQRGFTSLDDTLSAEQNWRVIRVQLASAQVQALRRTVQAYKAIGGGWPAQAYAAK